jgi:hypothetical protein
LPCGLLQALTFERRGLGVGCQWSTKHRPQLVRQSGERLTNQVRTGEVVGCRRRGRSAEITVSCQRGPAEGERFNAGHVEHAPTVVGEPFPQSAPRPQADAVGQLVNRWCHGVKTKTRQHPRCEKVVGDLVEIGEQRHDRPGVEDHAPTPVFLGDEPDAPVVCGEHGRGNVDYLRSFPSDTGLSLEQLQRGDPECPGRLVEFVEAQKRVTEHLGGLQCRCGTAALTPSPQASFGLRLHQADGRLTV